MQGELASRSAEAPSTFSRTSEVRGEVAVTL